MGLSLNTRGDSRLSSSTPGDVGGGEKGGEISSLGVLYGVNANDSFSDIGVRAGAVPRIAVDVFGTSSSDDVPD